MADVELDVPGDDEEEDDEERRVAMRLAGCGRAVAAAAAAAAMLRPRGRSKGRRVVMGTVGGLLYDGLDGASLFWRGKMMNSRANEGCEVSHATRSLEEKIAVTKGRFTADHWDTCTPGEQSTVTERPQGRV